MSKQVVLPIVAEWASIVGAVLSALAFGGVLFVRYSVDAAVKRQTLMSSSLRASSECRNLLEHLTNLRSFASMEDWRAVFAGSLDARRSAVVLSAQLDELKITGAIAGVIAQLGTLETAVSRALKSGDSPDSLKVQRILAKQQDGVILLSGRLERLVQDANVRR